MPSPAWEPGQQGSSAAGLALQVGVAAAVWQLSPHACLPTQGNPWACPQHPQRHPFPAAPAGAGDCSEGGGGAHPACSSRRTGPHGRCARSRPRARARACCCPHSGSGGPRCRPRQRRRGAGRGVHCWHGAAGGAAAAAGKAARGGVGTACGGGLSGLCGRGSGLCAMSGQKHLRLVATRHGVFVLRPGVAVLTLPQTALRLRRPPPLWSKLQPPWLPRRRWQSRWPPPWRPRRRRSPWTPQRPERSSAVALAAWAGEECRDVAAGHCRLRRWAVQRQRRGMGRGRQLEGCSIVGGRGGTNVYYSVC